MDARLLFFPYMVQIGLPIAPGPYAAALYSFDSPDRSAEQ